LPHASTLPPSRRQRASSPAPRAITGAGTVAARDLTSMLARKCACTRSSGFMPASAGCSSGTGRIAYPVHPSAAPPYRNDVEAQRRPRQRGMRLQESLRTGDELPLFPAVDRLCGSAEGIVGPIADLGNDDGRSIAQHEIELAPAAAEVARDHRQPGLH